jgi:glycosyltransferase involved in cell wall biosynthesis
MTSSVNRADVLAHPVVPVPLGVERPRWSVMIPTFNCAAYLGKTLESVLCQDQGPDRMHIEVVDDCSTADDPETVVHEVGGGRVGFTRNATNQGAIRNFNSCLNRSVGELVQVLHGDDLVAPGYYAKIDEMERAHPGLGLYATRNFFIDDESIIFGVSERITALEMSGRTVEPFLYNSPLQFAGVTARRSSYEALGGFREELVHTADCEMWARIVSAHGGVVSRDVASYYRIFGGNDTGRLARAAENVRDLLRLSDIYEKNYTEYSPALGRKRAAEVALAQFRKFRALGDREAARANYDLWIGLTSRRRRLRMLIGERVLPLIRTMFSD